VYLRQIHLGVRIMKLKEISVKKIITGVKEHWNTPPEVSPKQPRHTGLLFGNSFASSSLADCKKKQDTDRYPASLGRSDKT
jgi:hypothetical protein